MSEQSWGGFRHQTWVACHYFCRKARCPTHPGVASGIKVWSLVIISALLRSALCVCGCLCLLVFVFVFVFVFVVVFACLCLCLCLCLPHEARCPNNPGVASGIKVWSLVIISARKLDVRKILGWLQASKWGRLSLFP